MTTAARLASASAVIDCDKMPTPRPRRASSATVSGELASMTMSVARHALVACPLEHGSNPTASGVQVSGWVTSRPEASNRHPRRDRLEEPNHRDQSVADDREGLEISGRRRRPTDQCQIEAAVTEPIDHPIRSVLGQGDVHLGCARWNPASASNRGRHRTPTTMPTCSCTRSWSEAV